MKPFSLQSAGLAIVASLALCPKPVQAEVETLTNAVNVLSLTAEQARREIPVLVSGVVTVAETGPSWKGKFFVQDTTGGVFVNNTNSRQPLVGDFVEVRGVSHPGGYAPDITQPVWRKLGTAPLPPARPVTAERLMSGKEDGQRVEVSGVVRSAQIGTTRLSLELASGGYRFRAFPPVPTNLEPSSLIGATVRIRGTAAASFNAPLRHILTVAMFVPQESDFIVEHFPGHEVFEQPFTPLDGIAQYRREGAPGGRIRVKGVVTYQRPGEDIFLHDVTGGLQVKTSETNLFARGETVEAIGFPDLEQFLPVLRDATLIQTQEPRTVITPGLSPPAELLAGLHHSDPITLQARLLDRSFRKVGPPGAKNAKAVGEKGILMLQSSNLVFVAEVATGEGLAGLKEIPVGSALEASGICMLQLGEEGKAQSLQLLVPSADNIRVLQRPSWWTPKRLWTGLAVLLAVLILAISWSVMIMRKNSALRTSIAEKVEAQHELQVAHDLLEFRVQERTKQLKFEMTARKEAEVQFKATLRERTRLAQELHDTLEQSLTGIGLQLDTAGRLSNKEPGRSNHHLELARSLMTQSQLELRRSIWDLRSRELEQFDLASALEASGRQILDGTGVQFQVTTEGHVRQLSEVVEENLLRIGREALTNVIKHSQARTVNIGLKFGPQSVGLRVKDDGNGFALENSVGAKEGHFGLTGMGERTRRLDGKLVIESAPGKGTCVDVEIPIHAVPADSNHKDEDTSEAV